MTEHDDDCDHLVAHGDRLSDAHLGLLLADLQLGAGTTSDPQRYRDALTRVANAVGRMVNPDGDARRGQVPRIRAA